MEPMNEEYKEELKSKVIAKETKKLNKIKEKKSIFSLFSKGFQCSIFLICR